MKQYFLLLTIACLVTACSIEDAADPKAGNSANPTKQKAPSQSTASQVIDGMTGRTAVRHGRVAMDTIKEVSEKKKADLDEVQGEE